MPKRMILLLVVLGAVGVAVIAITNYMALTDLRNEVTRLNGAEAASSDTITESVQGVESSTRTLGDKIDVLIELTEEAGTPHRWCADVREELEYASREFNSRLDNNIYKQQLFQARIDALMGLAAVWNCPLQSFYGFTSD